MKLLDFAAAPASIAFHREIFEEHLEECSFLYEQRLARLSGTDRPWHEVAQLENRIDAHINALVVGEDLALDICRRQAEEGDFGELYAAVCVFCRQNRRELLGKVLKKLDAEDAEKLRAVTDALKDEIPEEWAKLLVGNLGKSFEKLIPLCAEVSAYRRFPHSATLIGLVRQTAPESLPSVFWALGRLSHPDTAALLRKYVQYEQDAVCNSALLALLRLGDKAAWNHCISRVRLGDPATFIPAALAGEQSSAKALRTIAGSKKVYADCLLGLGVLGELRAVRVIFEHLENPDLAETAATALQLITGADLVEEAFIPEEIDEDELFEEELEKFKQGEVPQHLDGRPFGTNVVRISQKQDDWRKWLEAHKGEFDPRFRYRRGKPYSPQTLLDTLFAEQSPYRVRQLAYEELVIRYAMDIPFEADMRVVEQEKRLAQISEWVEANEQRFPPGFWYFAGRPTS